MPKSLFRVAAATAITALSTLAVTGHVSAHSNSIVCIDQATSTFRITNDYPLAESFTSPQGPSGTVAAGNGSYTDVIYVGDSLQIDAVWTDGFTESRTGIGDCTPEGGTTTTTELVTTTTEQETTTSPSTTTSEPGTTTSTTDSQTTTTTQLSTTLPPTTSSSVATTSTTSVPTSTASPTTAIPTTSVTPPTPSSTTPECSDNPNTPTDDCAPICQPVTQPDGTNSCGPSLPATGTDVVWLTPAAVLMMLCGGVIVICGRRR